LDSTQVTSDWQEYSLAIPPSHFNNVKIFVTVSFQYTQPPRTTEAGTGGEVYLDDVKYANN
jgi:hypothetical protein